MPNSIEISADSKSVLFKSIFSKRQIEIKKILKVETTPFNSSFITFKHEAGKFTLINSIDGLHELIHKIKEVNPNLKTKGC